MTWYANPFTSAQNAAQAYARVGLETGVASTDALGLVLMLYDGVLKCLTKARGHMERREIAAKGAALSHALQILDEGLMASLNEADGGGVAAQLRELYAYMCRRIVLANLKNDPAVLDEVSGLLRELRQAWAEIAKERAA